MMRLTRLRQWLTECRTRSLTVSGRPRHLAGGQSSREAAAAIVTAAALTCVRPAAVFVTLTRYDCNCDMGVNGWESDRSQRDDGDGTNESTAAAAAAAAADVDVEIVVAVAVAAAAAAVAAEVHVAAERTASAAATSDRDERDRRATPATSTGDAAPLQFLMQCLYQQRRLGVEGVLADLPTNDMSD